jgi:hypothetical protein
VCVCVCVCVCDIVVDSGVSISGEYIHDRKKITWVYMTGSAHQTEVNSPLSILYPELESEIVESSIILKSPTLSVFKNVFSVHLCTP